MLRFLLGVLLAQVVTALLLWLNADSLTDPVGWVKVLVPTLAVSIVTAFWFGAISRQNSETQIARLRDEFSKEREKIRARAEKDKAQVVEKSKQEIIRESRKTNAKANFKVGAALTGAVGFGVLMMFTQFAAMGLLLLTGAGGALGGYMMRFKRERALTQKKDLQSVPKNITNTGTVQSGEVLEHQSDS